MIQDSQSLPIEVCTRWRGASFSVAHRGGQQRGMEEEEEDGRGYLVSRIIKAGDPLGFVYVVEGPGERGGVWRKERRGGKREEKGAERGEEAVETEAERRTEKLKWARKEREREREGEKGKKNNEK